MPESLLADVWAGLSTSSPTEVLAVALGLAYVVLAALGSRWCWPAGGASATLYVWLSWRAALPMQALLQLWYVIMAVQGWRRWSTPETAQLGWWPLRRHLLVVGLALVAGLAMAQVLQSQLQSGWPFLDSFTTLLSLFATWLTTRLRLESWIYWILIDAVLAWLYGAQGLHATSLLFLVYVFVCLAGLRTWLHRYHLQSSAR